jgi:phosphatidylinositol alpha-mannosyltransferase
MDHRSLDIWLVSQSYLPYQGGITEHVWHLARELARRGHRVSILTGRAALNGHPCSDPDPPGVRVIRLGHTLRVPSHGARACVTFGWNWHAKLRRLLPSRPEIVHIQSPLEPFLPLWVLRHAPGVKIGTFHTGGRHSHWGYRNFAPWLRRAADRLDARIGVSNEAARFVSRHFPARSEIIPNGVDLARFPPPAPANCHPEAGNRPPAPHPAESQPGETRILFVGRLDPRKGLDVLLEAFAQLVRTGAPRSTVPRGIDPRGTTPRSAGQRRLRLVIVGEGPLGSQLQRRVARLNLPVSFAGGVPRAELPRYYHEAELFVAPSSQGESFGVSLLEAMAAGLPILASDITGYRETLHGSGARFFSASSKEDLCRALGNSLREPEQMHEIADRQRRFVRRYAWDTVAARIEDVYFQALTGSSARAAAARAE